MFEPPRLPAPHGATGWLNSAPLRGTELRGRVVLVQFWTLTCINWLRTQPHVRALSRVHRDDGLIVLGLHPGLAHGADVDEDGHGLLTEGRLCQLVRQGGPGPRAHPGDHVPGAGGPGVRVHLRLTRSGTAGDGTAGLTGVPRRDTN